MNICEASHSRLGFRSTRMIICEASHFRLGFRPTRMIICEEHYVITEYKDIPLFLMHNAVRETKAFLL